MNDEQTGSRLRVASRQSPRIWHRLATSSAAAMVVLTGCTAPAPAQPGPAVTVQADAAANDADLHFAETMPGHHDQAIEMSKMLLAKNGVTPELVDLANSVQEAHQNQLDTMTTWPNSWAAAPAVPHNEDDPDDSSSGHHGGQGGLMTENQMRDLDLATTPDAQTLYLDGMIRHHEGALTLAVDEVRSGKQQDAVTLAEAIAETHPDEIATMISLRATF